MSTTMKYEATQQGRFDWKLKGPNNILVPMKAESWEVNQIITELNNWNEVKRLFLATDVDSEQFIDAISRMIQEEAK